MIVKSICVSMTSVTSTTTVAPATAPPIPVRASRLALTMLPPTWNTGSRLFTASPSHRIQNIRSTEGRSSGGSRRRQPIASTTTGRTWKAATSNRPRPATRNTAATSRMP